MSATSSPDRIEAFVRDIEAIPATLERVAETSAVEAVRAAVDAALGGGPPPARVVLTGLGSSRFAALQAEARFDGAGFQVAVVPASAAAGITGITPPARGASSGVLTVAISSSGRTPEVVAAAQRARREGRCLAITLDERSPLAAVANAMIPLPIEPERSGIAITSFVATIAVLFHVAAELGRGPRLDTNAAAVSARRVLETRPSWLPGALETLGPSEEVAVLAPWWLIGVAEQAALLLREGPRRSAVAFETAEWLHTGVYTALPGSVVGLLEGSPADEEVERTVTGRGGRVLRLAPGGHDGPSPGADPAADALAAITGPALVAAERWRAIAVPAETGPRRR